MDGHHNPLRHAPLPCPASQRWLARIKEISGVRLESKTPFIHEKNKTKTFLTGDPKTESSGELIAGLSCSNPLEK